MSTKRRDGHDHHDEDHLVADVVDTRLLRRLLQFARPHALALGGSFALLVVTMVLQILGPSILRVAIDGPITDSFEQRGEPGYDMGAAIDEIQRLALLFLFVTLAQGATMASKEWLMNRTGQRIVLSLRTRLFDHVLRLPISWFDRKPVGWTVTRTTSDVDTLNELFSSGLVSLTYDVLSIIVMLGVLAWVSPALSLTAFVILPIMILVSFRFRLRARNAFRRTRASLARLNAFLQERLSGLGVVQLFRREDASSQRFSGLNGDYWSDNMLTVRHFSLFFPTVDGLSEMVRIGVLVHASYLIGIGSVTFGEFFMFWMLLTYVFEPIRELAERYNILQAAMAAAERIFGILDTTTEDRAAAPRAIVPPRDEAAPAAIEFEHVTFAYGDGPPVLEDLSFRVAPGERVAVVGHTGAGKTTLVSLLCRFHETPHGVIRVDGRDICSMSHAELRGQIAIVQQDVFMFSDSVRNNITMGDPTVPVERVRAMARAVNADRFVERMSDGYDTVLRERGDNLSTGQRQLIAFARALSADPRILVLDEATSSVDSESETLIEEATATLMKGRTSLVIAHRLSTIVNADRILVLHKGRLREQGTHAELLEQRGLYWKLFRLHIAGAQVGESARGDATARGGTEPPTRGESPRPAPDTTPDDGADEPPQ